MNKNNNKADASNEQKCKIARVKKSRHIKWNIYYLPCCFEVFNLEREQIGLSRWSVNPFASDGHTYQVLLEQRALASLASALWVSQQHQIDSVHEPCTL